MYFQDSWNVPHGLLLCQHRNYEKCAEYFCACLFPASAIKRKYRDCRAPFSETLTIHSPPPQWWKPSSFAQPGCSIPGSSYGNTGHPTGLQAVITWNEYFNYIMILITALLPLLQLVLHTPWNGNLHVPLAFFLFWGGGDRGWDFTGEWVILITTCTLLLVSLQLGRGGLPDPFPGSSTSAVISCRPLCGFGGQGSLTKWKLYFNIWFDLIFSVCH